MTLRGTNSICVAPAPPQERFRTELQLIVIDFVQVSKIALGGNHLGLTLGLVEESYKFASELNSFGKVRMRIYICYIYIYIYLDKAPGAHSGSPVLLQVEAFFWGSRPWPLSGSWDPVEPCLPSVFSVGFVVFRHCL